MKFSKSVKKSYILFRFNCYKRRTILHFDWFVYRWVSKYVNFMPRFHGPYLLYCMHQVTRPQASDLLLAVYLTKNTHESPFE